MLIRSILDHPANRGRAGRAVCAALLWQVWKRVVRRPVTIGYHGLKLRCHPDSRQASAAIYFSGCPDFWEMQYLADTLKPGDCFVDVGANIGLYTLMAASLVGPSGRVHSFEPGERAGRRLAENLERNNLRQVTVHSCAVGAEEGALLLEEDGEDCTARAGQAGGSGGRKVPVVCLDRILSGESLAAVKIDIEGFEPFALRGLREHLGRGIPGGLLVEAAGYSNTYGITTEELLKEMAALGYLPHRYDPERKACLPAPRHWEAGLSNVLFLRGG